MEDIEELSLAEQFSLAELLEVEVPILHVIPMNNEQPCCSKSLNYDKPLLCPYSSSDESIEKNEVVDDDEKDEKTSDESDKNDKTDDDSDEINSTKSSNSTKKKKENEPETDKKGKVNKKESGSVKADKGKRKKSNEKKRSHKKKKLDKPNAEKQNKSDKKKESNNTEENDSSDEDVNQLNKVAEQMSEYKSIKDLPEKTFFKVLQFEIVETVNGRTVRIQLEDSDLEEGFFYVHLPKKFLGSVEANFKKYKSITESKKPFFFAFLGQKGRAFKVVFTRNPDKF